MLFRSIFTLAALSSVSALPNGGSCELDSDCDGGLNCIRTGLFSNRRNCAPVECAKGAARALLDYGFNAEEYIASVRGKTGLRNSDFVTLTSNAEKEATVQQAIAITPPPMNVFHANYSMCLNPDDEGARKLQVDSSTTLVGLMWSLAAGFSYFGKSAWGSTDFGGFPVDVQHLTNCIGGFLGGDVGLDLLIQVFDEGSGRSARKNATETLESGGGEEDANGKASVSFDFNTQFVPVITVGPFGIQVGWPEDGGPESGIITEVTLGPSLGAGLLGFNQCFGDVTYSSDL